MNVADTMQRPAFLLLPFLMLGTWPIQGIAQMVFRGEATTVTVEAFANATAGAASDETGTDAGEAEGVVDAEIRVLGLARLSEQVSIGPRVTLRASAASALDDEIDFGEESLLIRGPWGRIEIGERRGLPDVLTGYAPNNFQFVSAEYGPASGRSLDPDGGLHAAVLGGAIGGQIDSLAALGITASFFFDESAKIIYVSPKKRGFIGGISIAPDARNIGGRFRELVQFGLTHETYRENLVYRLGGTYAFANGSGDALTGGNHDLHSLSLGGTATIADSLSLGASFTWNPEGGVARTTGPGFRSDALGYAASINYNAGPWSFGGFFQSGRAEGDAVLPGDDSLNAFQLGISYRLNTRTRLYGAGYFLEFENEGGHGVNHYDGAILLLGARIAL